jgi:beta-glucosidase
MLHISQSSQEMGSALANVLFGKISPAGRLVQTWVSSIDQLPPILDYNIRNGRTYMYSKNEPLFPFGFGLTYTSFKYSNPGLKKNSFEGNETVDVTFDLTNTGNFDSDEVPQVYVSFPESKVERPIKALKGFKRVFVKKGETIRVTIPIKTADLTFWDVDKQAFVLEPGKMKIMVGSSSANILLEKVLTIK